MHQNPRPFSAEELSAAWRRYIRDGIIEYPEQNIVALCREMKWGWEKYLSEPEWFTKMLLWLMIEEAKEAKRRSQ
jgi:hypothetical protein